MSNTTTLIASKRDGHKKAVTKVLRSEGKLPAVIYGGKDAAQSITLDAKEMFLNYQKGWFTARVIELEIDGKKQRTIAREVQLHPVTDKPLHVDFQRLESGSTVRLEIPLEFTGLETSPGLKKGGVLNKVRRSVELICPADSIPTVITADISELGVKDSLHYSHLDVPKDCVATIDRDFTIATIAGRAKKEEEEDALAAATAAEGEEVAEEGSEESAEA